MIKKIIILCLLLTILILFNLVINVENFINKNVISVCIPCIKRDQYKLFRLIDSIEKQYVKPHEIVISLSGVENNKKNKLFYKKLQQNTSIKIKLIFSKYKKYAGENRNIATENSKGNIIIYIDADDLMKPNRIERILELFNKYNCKCILHSFENNLTNITTKNKTKIYDSNFMYNLHKKCKTPFLHIDNENILHHGHLSIKREVFNKIKFLYNEKYKRGQDSKFVRDILDYYKNKNSIIFTNEKLSYYVASKNQ